MLLIFNFHLTVKQSVGGIHDSCHCFALSFNLVFCWLIKLLQQIFNGNFVNRKSHHFQHDVIFPSINQSAVCFFRNCAIHFHDPGQRIPFRSLWKFRITPFINKPAGFFYIFPIGRIDFNFFTMLAKYFWFVKRRGWKLPQVPAFPCDSVELLQTVLYKAWLLGKSIPDWSITKRTKGSFSVSFSSTAVTSFMINS